MTRHETDILSWDRGAARVVSFSTASARTVTTVKIEMRVTSAWELGDLMRRLAELRDLPDETKPGRRASDG